MEQIMFYGTYLQTDIGIGRIVPIRFSMQLTYINIILMAIS